MTTTTTTTAADRLLELAVHTAHPDVSATFAADAVLDATIPNWRMTIDGDKEIGNMFALWFAYPGILEELERHPTPTGEVVTYTVTWEENGVPHAAHHVHVLTIVDDRIVRDGFWCGGRWPAPLLAEMEAAGR
jgi:hypothetical protein